jgi:myosin-crossreactive antigen
VKINKDYGTIGKLINDDKLLSDVQKLVYDLDFLLKAYYKMEDEDFLRTFYDSNIRAIILGEKYFR